MRFPPLAERLEAKTRRTDSCWLWTGVTNRHKGNGGYGMIGTNGKSEFVHRIAWELKNGQIPEGQCVLHKCDVPLCINPSHLFLGTLGDNAADRAKKGRNPHQKLDWEKVREILADTRSNTELGRKYGVSQSVISRIRARISWQHAS